MSIDSRDNRVNYTDSVSGGRVTSCGGHGRASSCGGRVSNRETLSEIVNL